MLDADTKQKWITALRSGEYKQMRNGLSNYHDKENPSYCCLGVLCVVADIPMYDRNPRSDTYLEIGKLVPDWTKLSLMNDRDKKDFNYIADYIEKNIEAK